MTHDDILTVVLLATIILGLLGVIMSKCRKATFYLNRNDAYIPLCAPALMFVTFILQLGFRIEWCGPLCVVIAALTVMYHLGASIAGNFKTWWGIIPVFIARIALSVLAPLWLIVQLLAPDHRIRYRDGVREMIKDGSWAQNLAIFSVGSWGLSWLIQSLIKEDSNEMARI